jgi:hypothetical protein
MKMKRRNDYLPGETRAEYIERRKAEKGRTGGRFIRTSGVTLAKPGTREYRRIQKDCPSGHLKILDKLYSNVKDRALVSQAG